MGVEKAPSFWEKPWELVLIGALFLAVALILLFFFALFIGR
ncbi:MAG: hypothetical protein ABR573_02260 [Candidatus Dormibacteria bacterium]